MGGSRCPTSLWGLCGGGLSGSLVASVLLAAEQFAVHVIADLGAVRAAGSVIFFIVAAIVGWTFLGPPPIRQRPSGGPGAACQRADRRCDA